MRARSSNSQHWTRASELDSAAPDEKRIFAIVSRPIPAGPNGKTARRIVIFDNHPASLDLVFKMRAAGSHDEPVPQGVKRRDIILFLALILLAMLWPLL